MHKLYSSKAFQFFAIVIMSLLCLLLDTLTRINFNRIELPKNSPEYNAIGVDGSVYSKTGKLLYNLTSNTAWQFPNDKRIYMSDINILVYNKNTDAVKYKLNSDDGWISPNEQLGFLGKKTQLNVDDADKITTIYGENINLDLNKNVFVSKENIKAMQGKSIIMGRGFSYDRDKEYLIINSKVKVIYVS